MNEYYFYSTINDNILSISNIVILRGPGPGGSEGSEVDFQFLIVSDKEECQLPRTFYGMKKYISLLKLSHLEI